MSNKTSHAGFYTICTRSEFRFVLWTDADNEIKFDWINQEAHTVNGPFATWAKAKRSVFDYYKEEAKHYRTQMSRVLASLKSHHGFKGSRSTSVVSGEGERATAGLVPESSGSGGSQ